MHAYDDSTVDFFETEILSRADLVYRFGVVLTGAPIDAQVLLFKTFGEVAKEFPKVMKIRDFNINAYLLAECWRHYWGGPRGAYKPQDHEVGRLLGDLPVESRSALFAIDIVGLSAGDAAKALGTTEKDIRVKLAAARRALLASAH